MRSLFRKWGWVAVLLVAAVVRAGNQPEWVKKNGAGLSAYPLHSYVTGFGVSGNSGEEADKRREALAMARSELISAIRVRITSKFVDEAIEKDKKLSQMAVSLVKTESQMELEGLDQYEYFFDAKRGVYYVLAVMDKAKAANLLKDKIRALSDQCQALLKAAQPGDGEDVSTLLNAKHLAVRIEENMIVFSVLTGSFPSDLSYPKPEAVSREIRHGLSGERGLDGYLGRAAFDVGDSLPEGIRVLVDGIYYADTRFGGTFSFYAANALSEKWRRSVTPSS